MKTIKPKYLQCHNIVPIFLTLLTFLKFTAPSNVESAEWKRPNTNLKSILYPLHHHIARCNNSEDLKILGDQATELTVKFCLENQELLLDDPNPSTSKFKSHPNKTIAELEATKKQLQKEAFKPCADPEKKLFHQFCKTVSDLKKREKIKQNQKNWSIS